MTQQKLDREKVIKGLECCHDTVDCRHCPYPCYCEYADAWPKQLMTDALALLKEQEAVKPVLDEQTCGKVGEVGMRLIDADALIGEIERRQKAAKTLTGVDMVMLVNDMQTIDAVPVVRCRKCKNLQLRDYICDITGLDVKPDDYCSKGERVTW